MKRSLAPSLSSASKRKFVTPFASVSRSTPSEESSEDGSMRLHQTLQKIRQKDMCTSREIGDLSAECEVTEQHTSDSQQKQAEGLTVCAEKTCRHVQSFKPPSKLHQPQVQEQDGSRSCSASAMEKIEQKYYSVMWCKMSKKKHKTWEGDAILLIKGSSAILQDMEGKSLAKGLGYRGKELSDLVEGSTLIVGGKEVEVMTEISASEWKSGKCFLGEPSEQGPGTSVLPRPSLHRSHFKKGFSNPSHGKAVGTSDVCLSYKPLHDPTSINALVMPKPSPKHQLKHNSSGFPVVDVVVDPHISAHLRPHQRDGVTFLYECLMGMKDFSGYGAILADEMGLGKTLQCIAVLWTFLKQGAYARKPIMKKAIIITPGSLVKNWEKEFNKWLGRERVKVFATTSENRVEDFVKSPIYPVLIISYEMFLRSHDALKKVPFDVVVCDEGHRLKNNCGKTASLIMGILTRKRIVLTGTPIQNDLQEFYSIVEFCNPGILGTQAAFRRVYEVPIIQSKLPTATAEEKDLGEMRAQELNRLISLFCLRRTQEINKKYLPPKVENIVFCQMVPLQVKVYKHILGSRLVRSCLKSHTSDFSPHLVCIGALKKLCNSASLIHSSATHATQTQKTEDCLGEDQCSATLFNGVLPLYPSEYNPSSCDDSGKLRVLSGMLKHIHSATSERVVVVSNYTKTLDVLQVLCESSSYHFLRLDGSTPSAKRQQLVERFNSMHCRETVFLLSCKAGGVGLNLTGASRLILYDIDWNPANDQQAMARVWRDGQQRKVHIYRLLCAGSIEEKIFQRQISKQSLNVVVDGNQLSGDGKSQFSLEELKDLFTFHETTPCDTHELLGCSCTHDGPNESEGVSSAASLYKQDSSETKKLNEMMSWRHYRCPLDNINDELLQQAGTSVTFVFQKQHYTATESL